MGLFSTTAHQDGGCRCGQVTYRVTEAARFTFICHCTDCQSLSASAFSMGIIYPEDQFKLTSGELREWTKIGSSGKPSVSSTCPVCATWICTRPHSQPGLVVVRASSLDKHGDFRPTAQIFTRSALAWAVMPTLFSYEEEFADPEPIARAYAAREAA